MNSPAAFQRYMLSVIGDMRYRNTLCYVDDLIVYSETFAQHIRDLRELLCCLKTAGIKLQPEKCHFGKKSVEFLGHVVGVEGVQPNPMKVAAINEWGIPQCEGELLSFLQLCSYYRRFVPKFSCLARPLRNAITEAQKMGKLKTKRQRMRKEEKEEAGWIDI